GNMMPVADAGDDATVEGCTVVTLDGSGSNDPDSGPMPLSYSWTQTAGPAVTLASAGTASPSFEAPNVGSSTEVTFELTVSDSAAMSTDSVTITITPSTGPNHDTIGLYSG